MYSIMLSANSDSLTFSNLDSFSFSSLIAIARTSKTMFNKSGKSRHLCLISDFRKSASSFSLMNMVLAVGLSYGLCYVEVCFFYAHFLGSFYHKKMPNFVESLFCIYWDFIWILFFSLFMCNLLIDLKSPCILGINPTWSWCVILLIYCWI